jgi:hypothetical protein
MVSTDMVNTEKEKKMSQMFIQFVERLAEMFPKQNYQSRLEQYLSTKSIQSVADVEHWQRQYDNNRNFS